MVDINSILSSEDSHKFLSTVWHTGTHTLAHELGYAKLEWHHCDANALDKLKGERSHCSAWTTYRDPLRVAASWFNRYGWNESTNQMWLDQWKAYREIKKLCHIVDIRDLPVMNSHKDKQAHKLLDSGNMTAFYRLIPQQSIEFAQDCANA